MKLGFIGAGKVGTGLAIALSSKNYPVVGVYDTIRQSAENFAASVKGCKIMSTPQEVADNAEFVFITTPDAYIEQVCSSVKWQPKQYVVHCSGANTVQLLQSAKKAGAYVGVFHPGLTFADTKQAAKNIPGSTFDIESGDEILLNKFKEMAASLDSNWIVVKAEEKPVYHVAVEFTSLFVMLLFRMSADMMQAMGITEEEAVKAALPMIRGTANNIENNWTSQPLTGPADRGDVDTIRKHIDGLAKIYPKALPLYREMVRQNVSYAIRHKVIDSKKADEILSLVNNYKI